MNKQKLSLAVFVLILVFGETSAQINPGAVPKPKPTLKRDRTPRLILPKIVQHEDERTVNEDLFDLLSSPNALLRRRAIIAVGRIGSPSGIDPLISVLKTDRNASIRALAVFSLGEIESQHAVPELLERLEKKDENAMVRARTAEALGKIASNRVSADSLGSYGVVSIAKLLTGLLPDPSRPPSADEKQLAAFALTALLRLRRAETVAPVAQQLKSPDDDIRWQAANTLARIREGIEGSAPDLLRTLDDKNPLARAASARALGAAKDKRSVEILIKLLADQDQRVIANAIAALGSVADSKAVEPLIALGYRLLDSYRLYDRNTKGVPPEQNMLLLIATSLGNIGDKRSLAFLKTFRVADGKLGGHPEVEAAIAKFGDDAFFDVPKSVSLQKDDWRALRAYAQGLGVLKTDRAKTTLLDLISGKNGETRDARAIEQLLSALGAAKVDGLRQIALGHLKHEDVIVRARAAGLLGELGDSAQEVLDALEVALRAARNDKMNDAKLAIIEAAAKLKRPSLAMQLLSGPNSDTDYVVRRRATELLRESDGENLLVRLPVGKVETGHDRSYWRNVALLSILTKNPTAILRTAKGEIRIELFAADAPMTVYNFIQLSRAGFYNGLSFMRVVPNFVIQGGDPRGDMEGGPGYQIRCEINTHQYGIGTVGMALSGKDTGGSQFFITHSPQPHLDGGYTVFGRVVEGMGVVDKIGKDDRIERIEIIGAE